MDQVVVVGSRIRRIDIETSQPVFVLEREQLELFLCDVVQGRATLAVRSVVLARQLAHALLRVGAPWSLETGDAGEQHRLVRRTSVVTLPADVWDDIDKARGAVTLVELGERSGFAALPEWYAAHGRVPRNLAAHLAEVLDDDQLRWWASPDVLWDEIVEVRFPDGAPWVSLELSDTDELAVMAIQRADGDDAKAQAGRLAALVAHHRAAR